VKADTDDGWYKVANTLSLQECSVYMSANEWRVYNTIKHFTFSYRKTLDWIAASQYEEKTGILAKKISEIKKRLIDRKILITDGRKIGINTIVSDWEEKPITPKQGYSTLPLNRDQSTPKQEPITPKQGKKYPQIGVHNKKDNSTKENITKDMSTKRIVKPQSFKAFFKTYPIHRKGGSDASAWKAWKSEKLTADDALLATQWLTHAAKQNPDWRPEANGQFIYGIVKFIRERIWLTPIQQPHINWKQTKQDTNAQNAQDIQDWINGDDSISFMRSVDPTIIEGEVLNNDPF
jgi:phage replication O-like protein O